MFCKIAALVLIIIVGIGWMLIMERYENFKEPFKDSETDLGKLAVAFYSGIFSYAGWNYLNCEYIKILKPKTLVLKRTCIGCEVSCGTV
jgi:amino acid transporter